MGGRLGKGLLVGVVALLAVPSANAAVRCVTPASGSDCVNTYPTIGDAVTSAQGGDTIRLGATAYIVQAGVTTAKRLDFVGVGAGPPDGAVDPTTQSIVIGGNGASGGLNGGAGSTALRLEAGGSVTGIRLYGGDGGGGSFTDGTGGNGLVLTNDGNSPVSYTLSGVVGVGGAGGGSDMGGDGYGLFAGSGMGGLAVASTGDAYRTRHGENVASSAAVRVAAAQTSASFSGLDARSDSPAGDGVLADAELRLDRSTVAGSRAVLAGDVEITRSRLAGRSTGLVVTGGAEGAATVANSLVTSEGFQAVRVDPNSAVPIALSARGSTFVVRGSQARAAVWVISDQAPASAELRNSIARLEGSTEPNAADLRAEGADAAITAANSSFSTRFVEAGGAAAEPGSGTNVSGDPLFVAPGSDYSLQPTSPLVDRGDPALVGAAELDLAGSPRALDGNGDCVAAPDVGAFELAASACAANVAPVVSAFRVSPKTFAPKGRARGAARRKRKVKRGTTFRYTLSEAAEVAINIERQLKGRRVKGKCRKPTRKNRRARRCKRFAKAGTLRASGQAGANSLAFSGRIRGKALKRGRYRANIVATDPEGAGSAPRRVTFTVTR